MLNKLFIFILLGCVNFITLCPFKATELTEHNSEPDARKLISLYRDNLPCIPEILQLSPMAGAARGQAIAIVDFMGNFLPQKLKGLIQLPSEGKNNLILKLEALINSHKPIEFVLVGFPGKSTNNEHKVFSSEIDLGEVLGLATLFHFVTEIEKYYSPCKVTVISEGILYMTTFLLSEEYLNGYIFGLNKICKLLGYDEKIHIIPLQDLPLYRQQEKSYQEIYNECYTRINSTLVAEQEKKNLRAYLLKEINCYNWDYNFYEEAAKFCNEEFQPLSHPKEIKINQKVRFHKSNKNRGNKGSSEKKDIDTTARELKITHLPLIVCELYYGQKLGGEIVSCYYNNYRETIRLSVHNHKQVDQKFTVELINNSEGTPWHYVPVFKEGKFSLDYYGNLKGTYIIEIAMLEEFEFIYFIPKNIYSLGRIGW